jgi:hypothetical protein
VFIGKIKLPRAAARAVDLPLHAKEQVCANYRICILRPRSAFEETDIKTNMTQ